jgi:radical SAM enzyme (TIGR01210 family)
VTSFEATAYPENPRERDAWILSLRSRPGTAPRAFLDPLRPYAFLNEVERDEKGEVVPVSTVFLTNRECPWRCLMCDLWRHTLTEAVPVGAIPAQIAFALSQLPPARQVKLYNSGSFFDQRAIPPQDYPAIASQLDSFGRVIVECHPSLVNEKVLRFHDLVGGKLEVALGLETVHPEIGPRLNKRATPEQFARACKYLHAHGIGIRAFILVKPPWMNEDQALFWACRSLDFAFECDASVAALIPTRGGNGALDELQERGEFSPPRLSTLEAALKYGLSLGRGRVFADEWDLERFSSCDLCFQARAERLKQMNLQQQILAPVVCAQCGRK